jgi:hypothetical protein
VSNDGKHTTQLIILRAVIGARNLSIVDAGCQLLFQATTRLYACAGVGAWVSLSRKEGILDYTQREGLVTPYLKESPILKMKPFALWAPNA